MFISYLVKCMQCIGKLFVNCYTVICNPYQYAKVCIKHITYAISDCIFSIYGMYAFGFMDVYSIEYDFGSRYFCREKTGKKIANEEI